MNNRYQLSLAVIAVSLSALLVFAVTGCSKHSAAGDAANSPRHVEKPAVAVTVTPIVVRSLERTVSLVGSFSGQEEVTIAPKSEGRVLKIHHDVGDVVHPGDVLLDIDDTDYKLTVEEARRAFESELAKLGLKKLPLDHWDPKDLPMIERARLLVSNAKTKFQRIETLAAKSMTTKDDFEQARTDLDVAQANYRQAVMDARATLATARHKKALLSSAEQHCRDTCVRVPTPASPPPGVQDVSYVVSQRMVSDGEMVQSNPPTDMFRLVMDNPLKLRATVPERHVGDIKVGLGARIEVDAYPGRTFQGEVARVNPTVDRTNRTFQLEIRVPNDVRELKPGNFAKAWIVTAAASQAVTVPRESLVSFAGVNKIFLVRDGKAQTVEVKLGARGEDWLEVIGQLDVNLPVVTSGQTQLADDTPVRVRSSSEQPSGDVGLTKR